MKEYVWMRQGEVFPVTDKEFLALLNQNQIRALCPTGEPEGQMVSQMELLLDERYVANGIVVERELFGEAGGRNMRLPAKWEYELALRVAEMVPIVLLPEGSGATASLAAWHVRTGKNGKSMGFILYRCLCDGKVQCGFEGMWCI